MYISSVVASGILIWWMLLQGRKLESGDVLSNPVSAAPDAGEFLVSSGYEPFALLVLQIITIIIVARIFSRLFSKIGQPLVVGEIIAGIVMGPSLVGLLFPGVTAFLFPETSLDNLQFLSQLGLIFFMFIVGMDLDIKLIKNKADNAVLVSHASIIFPFLLGVLLSYFLYSELAPEGIPFTSFSLFMGISLSITAFPVLARIIQERGLMKTPLGLMAITCAAVDDVTAWCLLAVVIAIVKSASVITALYSVALAVAYVILMFTVVRPLMNRIGTVYDSREILNKRIVAIVFLVLLGSVYVAEVIGIHALFGAFLAGVIMPENFSFKKIIAEKIEDVSLVLLLPLFFVLTGLRTQVTLLDTPGLVLTSLLIIVVAILGKLAGSAFAARFAGHSWRESLSLGVLMNTRGLMELIVLNIGYDLGILSREIFAMLVLMAIVTTFLTGPCLTLVERIFQREETAVQQSVKSSDPFRILISFGAPKMGSTLLRLADQLTMKHNDRVEVTALHITPSSELKPYDALLFEKEGFQPVRSTAQLLGIKLNTVYKNTEEIDKEILSTITAGNFDLVLTGAARPVFTDNATGGRLKNLLEQDYSNMGILIDRNFVMAESILLLLGSSEDLPLLFYAHRFKSSNKARVVILKMGDAHTLDFTDESSPYYSMAPSFNEVIEHRIPDRQLLSHFNLVLVSLNHWNSIVSGKASWTRDCPSVLVVKHLRDLRSDRTTVSGLPGDRLNTTGSNPSDIV